MTATLSVEHLARHYVGEVMQRERIANRTRATTRAVDEAREALIAASTDEARLQAARAFQRAEAARRWAIRSESAQTERFARIAHQVATLPRSDRWAFLEHCNAIMPAGPKRSLSADRFQQDAGE